MQTNGTSFYLLLSRPTPVRGYQEQAKNYRCFQPKAYKVSFFNLCCNQDTHIMKTPTHLSQIFSRCLLTCGAMILLSASTLNAETVSVLKDGVNVRTGPSTDDQIAMELFQGYPLKVLEKKGDWLKISDFENDTGWIHKSLVGSGDTLIVNAKTTINMRSEPSTSSTIVANIERGVVLTRISTKGDWVKVKHAQGTEGWISKSLLWP